MSGEFSDSYKWESFEKKASKLFYSDTGVCSICDLKIDKKKFEIHRLSHIIYQELETIGNNINDELEKVGKNINNVIANIIKRR